MKVRRDFVTNSSSSSYVIAFKSYGNVKSEILEMYPQIAMYKKMIKALVECDDYETSKGVIISCKEEYDTYLTRLYDFWECKTVEELLEREGERFKNDYNKVVDYLESGYSIIIKDVDYNAESFCDFLSLVAEDNPAFIIVKRD